MPEDKPDTSNPQSNTRLSSGGKFKVRAAANVPQDKLPDGLDIAAGLEMVNMIRVEARLHFGGNRTFVDDDLRAIFDQADALLATNADLERKLGVVTNAGEGLAAEFRKFSRYGSPIAMRANDAMRAWDAALTHNISQPIEGEG